jgi:ATP-dependent RNA helicase DHX57
MLMQWLSPGRTYPVEQLFLEDILDKTNYVSEENSGNSGRGDMISVEHEFEMSDIRAATSLIQDPATPDENLTVSQLYRRYKGKLFSVMWFVQKSV